MHKNESALPPSGFSVAAGTKTSERLLPSIESTVLHSILLAFMLIGAGWLGVLFSFDWKLAFLMIFVFAPLAGMLLTLFSRFHVLDLLWGGGGGMFFLFPVLLCYEIMEFPFILAGVIFFEIPVVVISLCFFRKNKINPPEYDKKYALFREFPKIVLAAICISLIAFGFFGFSGTLVDFFWHIPSRPDGLDSMSDYYVAGLMFSLTLVMFLFSRFKSAESFLAVAGLLLVLLPSGGCFSRIAPTTIYPFAAAVILAAVIKNTKLHR